MRVVVDREQCEANEDCLHAAPGVFALGDDAVVRVLVDEVPADREAEVRDAVDRCPKAALALREP
jgi:ferredoxin